MANQKINTNREIFFLARLIVLRPAFNKAVFYHGEDGKRKAESYVRQNVGSTTITDLLRRSPKGKELLSKLESIVDWQSIKEIWWELSRKMAQAASGDVHCFGSERLNIDGPVNAHRSTFEKNAYCHTVFEKVELPVLENNRRVESIFYNNKPLL